MYENIKLSGQCIDQYLYAVYFGVLKGLKAKLQKEQGMIVIADSSSSFCDNSAITL